MSLYLYTCIPVVGPVGSSGRCPLPGSLGSGVHRLIREMGPQARQGVSPEWGHRAAGSSGLWAHRLIGAQGPHPDKQGMQTHIKQKKQYMGPPGLGGPPSGSQGSRPVGELGPTGTSGSQGPQAHQGVGTTGSSGSLARQLDGLPDPGARRKWWNCNVAGHRPLGVYLPEARNHDGGQRGQIALRFCFNLLCPIRRAPTSGSQTKMVELQCTRRLGIWDQTPNRQVHCNSTIFIWLPLVGARRFGLKKLRQKRNAIWPL